MTHIARILLLIAGIATTFAHAESLEYTWLTIDQPSGAQTTTLHEDGSVEIAFHFSDRGRGPATTTRVVINDQGVPTQVSVTGVNYQKGEVDEQFTSSSQHATWRSANEKGDSAFGGDAFYLPNNGPPELMAMLARAILATDDNALPLLPTGTASLEVLDSAKFGDKNVTLYGIRGLDTNPAHVWLDDQKQLFGVDYGWFGMTRKGYETHIGQLKQRQIAANDKHFTAQRDRHTRPLEGLVAIRGARVFDSLTGELSEPQTVTIFDGKITALYPKDVTLPKDTFVIDGVGQTLLPTLWDMHGHVSANSYLNYLASGVTNVRDMANEHEVTTKLSRDVRLDRIAGPDVYALGFVDKRGEFAAPTGRLADTLQEAKDHIEFYAQHGYIGIKLYSSIDPDWVAPLAKLAHDRGMTVQGHVPAFMDAQQAIDAGYDEITHINMVLLNFLGAQQLDTRTPTRFKVPGEKAGTIDLTSREVRAFVKGMKERGIALDPTLSIFMNMFLNEPGKTSIVFRDIAEHLPANTRRQTIASASYNDGKETEYAAAAERSLELIRLLHDQGIRLLPGTDNMLPGFTLIRELMFYAQAGIANSEVLQLATIEASRHMQQDHRLGSITVGKEAHLYLVDGNPLDDLAALYKVRHVIKGRNAYFAPDMLTDQGFQPF
ncbi:MAG: amidohydrolase family protein [Gammaproteobacteria bacterium]